MKIEIVIASIEENVKLQAQGMADRGHKKYSVEMHSAIFGRIVAKALREGLEPTAGHFMALMQVAYNHSAWRQKLEKAKIFTAAEKLGASSLLSELAEEMGEEPAAE